MTGEMNFLSVVDVEEMWATNFELTWRMLND